jgi:hypothetical protein
LLGTLTEIFPAGALSGGIAAPLPVVACPNQISLKHIVKK